MKAYKFVSAEHADSVQKGSVRITPAHVFRHVDGYDDGRADPLELTNLARPVGGSFTISSDHPAIPDDMFVVIKGGKRIHVEMVMSGETVEFIDNALLYCLSTELSDDLRRRMKDTFGADAVFQISNVDLFGQVLSAHASLSSREFRSRIVNYKNHSPATTVDELSPVDPFEKREAFDWQKEYRMVWGGEVTSDAFQINVPDLVPLLTRLY